MTATLVRRLRAFAMLVLAPLLVGACVYDRAYMVERIAACPGAAPDQITAALESDTSMRVSETRRSASTVDLSSGTWVLAWECTGSETQVDVEMRTGPDVLVVRSGVMGGRPTERERAAWLQATQEVCDLLSERVSEVGAWSLEADASR